MIKWFKKTSTVAHDISPQEPSPGLVGRLQRSLSKTRDQLGEGLRRLLAGKKEIDATLLDELETLLLSADVGIDTTQYLLQQMTDVWTHRLDRHEDTLLTVLKERMQECLRVPSVLLEQKIQDTTPFVILMVGVNGAGKTTTIGKLAQHFQSKGQRVMLAAGDTFRAAAVEQLQVWGERNQVSVVAQHTGADSASVIFDAFQAAKARHIDVLIADTAGRLHTQNHLMEELKKIKRVLQKIDPAAPHEIMLVLDASIGQNALHQARHFHQALGVTGLMMTKLDGTAKGGIIFAIAHELGIPFRYLGTGEGLDDLRAFDAEQFVNAIFEDDSMQSSQ